jgi:hypothetical protein
LPALARSHLVNDRVFSCCDERSQCRHSGLAFAS